MKRVVVVGVLPRAIGERRVKEEEGRWRGILSLLQQPRKQVLGSDISGIAFAVEVEVPFCFSSSDGENERVCLDKMPTTRDGKMNEIKHVDEEERRPPFLLKKWENVFFLFFFLKLNEQPYCHLNKNINEKWLEDSCA